MTHAIQIPAKTVQLAPGTIITRETTIVHVQEDTRVKTANIMSVRNIFISKFQRMIEMTHY